MNFETFATAIRTQAFVCGNSPSQQDTAKANKVIAAAALVMCERGSRWCVEHPEEFRAELLKTLGTAVKIAVFVIGLFGGASIWLTIVGWVVPAVLNWLATQQHVYGACDFTALASEANEILKAK